LETIEKQSGITSTIRQKIILMKNNSARLIVAIITIQWVLSACAPTTPPLTPTLAPTAAPPTAAPTASRTAPPPSPTPVATLAPTITHPAAPTPAPTPTPVKASWWNKSTFYEVFVRSFYDSNGDGKGDFKGLSAKLDYLQTLGINSLWLMPIFASPSYHGYDVTDYLKVNPDYGTLQDFKELLSETHRRGMKMILDLPLNHTSKQHPWFVEAANPKSSKHNWYIWSQTDPGYAGPWDEKAWHKSPANGMYYYGVFWEGMPDLNYRNPEVVAEMDKIAGYWLKDIGVDGFRLDGARYIVEDGKNQSSTQDTHTYLKHFRQTVKAIKPDALLLGEVWTSSFEVSTYLGGDELDLAFNFDLAGSYMKAAANAQGGTAANQIFVDEKNYPSNLYGSFLTNHDMDRVMTSLGNDGGKARAAAAMVLTGPGIPFIYYGEEIGMIGAKPDEQIRTPMQWVNGKNAGFTSGLPWISVNSDYTAINVASQLDDPNSLLKFYQTIIGLRMQHPALLSGSPLKVEADNPAVYALFRTAQEEGMLILINLSGDLVKNVKLNLASGPLQGAYAAEPRFISGKLTSDKFAEVNANAQGGFSNYIPIPDLPPYSVITLQIIPLR
jgi:glycosidase